jgi:uncharacterized membrane protein HdeD (DUF308 family)
MTAEALERGRAGFPWWLVLIEGIALVILGIMWFASPGMTTLIAVTFLGVYWLVAGIFEIIGIFMDRSMWGWKLFIGILGILAGIAVMRHPLWSSALVGATLVIMLGIQGLIIGGVRIYQAFKGAGWGLGILGAVSILFGILLLANVWIAAFTLPWVLGALALVGGISAIVMAFRLK